MKHIYVANWFFAAYIITIAVLHIVNNLSIPVSATKSYVVYSGVVDAMVQWWYGHNAVGFFLTAAFLGMMYYFMPKQAGRPVYSYRLSVVHFWALIAIYMWAGPHHLHYTTLPDWAQSLGMVFSLILLAPSWGGMINGIMTLSGAWHKLRTDPILKFMIVSLSFYGMSTFEGPMMSIKTVNALSHYTDWTIGHVHSGALGWVAMISIGTMYALIPKLFGREQMYSVKAIDVHFWITTIGVVLYITSMWIAGVMQGLMWRATNADGTLTYAFIESIKATYPYYAVRLAGGTLVLSGMLHHGLERLEDGRGADHDRGFPGRCSRPEGALMNHETVEKNVGLMGVLIAVAISFGGLAQIVPLYFQGVSNQPAPGIKPYDGAASSPGRDVYVREGCYNCHSQMIRPFQSETERYGPYSLAGESVYDHPFQFGSKRTGPGPRARRRPLLGRLAPRALRQPARRRAGVEHAGLSVAREGHGRRRPGGEEDGRAADGGRAVHGRRHRRRGRCSGGQDRARCAHRLPAGPRHEPQGGKLSDGRRHDSRPRHAGAAARVPRARVLGIQQAS